MVIPNGVILIWTGTHAGIPAAWQRETTLDSKFAKAWGAEDPDITGGAATHTHTSPAHTHTMSSHSHAIVTSSNSHEHSSNQTDETGVTRNTKNGGHTHSGTIPVNSSSVSSDAATYGAVSNDPPYRKVIFIKPISPALLATSIVSLWNSDTAPTNWTKVAELQGRYLKGAGTGADADLVTDNGSSTNTHDISHGHTDSHTHSGASGGPSTGSSNKSTDGGSGDTAAVDHTHTISLASAAGSVSSTLSLVTTETVEPAYAKIQAIIMGAGGLAQVGMIGMWLGSVSAIPRGWSLCDGTNGTKDLRDKFIKIGNPADANGGANTHTHAAQGHTHTASSTHTHTGSVAAAAGSERRIGGGHNYWSTGATPHTLTSIDSQTVSYASSTTTADSSANQPEYRTVAYIQLIKIYNLLGRIIDA